MVRIQSFESLVFRFFGSSSNTKNLSHETSLAIRAHKSKQQGSSRNPQQDATTMTAEALMVDQDDAADADLLLQEYDLSENFVNMAHPEDGIVKANPITPEFIRHSRRWY
jgi:hypothetical protein